jgi:HEAT repeat protein
VQLHLKQAFDSLSDPSFAETNDSDRDQQDFDAAINDLKTAEDEEDRAYAVTVIGLSNKEEAIPAIIKSLDDPSRLVRQEAIERILGWPDDKQQEIMVIAALKSKDPDVVYVALESIYETNNKTLLRQINRLRKSKDTDIAKLASRVYKNLTEL